MKKRVVIIGGGFGGLHAARALRRAPVEVDLVDRRNFHLFQPLLYQVATGGLSPANIAAPLRSLLRRQDNAVVWLARAMDIDPVAKTVTLEIDDSPGTAGTTRQLHWDWLIVAAGVQPGYFGNDHWKADAPGLKTIEDATEIRRRVFSAFEAAEHEPDEARRRALMTFVVVGSGPTGVELAGAIAELARKTLRKDFRNINPPDARIRIVDGMDRVLPGFPGDLSERAQRSLQRLGVTVQMRTRVVDLSPDHVRLLSDDGTHDVATRTVLWAAGVTGVSLGDVLARATGTETDPCGRIPVQPDLSIAGHPAIFVIGDLARCPGAADGSPLPGVAPVAIQQGADAGRRIAGRAGGRGELPPFRYRDPGSMATIGRKAAVARLGPFRLGGYLAWLIWLVVHIMSIVQLQSRVLVFFQWAWNYFTFNRSARLITEKADPPDPDTEN